MDFERHVKDVIEWVDKFSGNENLLEQRNSWIRLYEREHLKVKRASNFIRKPYYYKKTLELAQILEGDI